MTTITDAHRAEARRRLFSVTSAYPAACADVLAQALAEPAWTPPVDPVEEAAIELINQHDIKSAYGFEGSLIREALRRGMEIAIKRSKSNG